MKLYNSKTQTIEEFTLPDHEVTLYVCGITPYDTTHLGHAFTYTTYDQLIRYFELKQLHLSKQQQISRLLPLLPPSTRRFVYSSGCEIPE